MTDYVKASEVREIFLSYKEQAENMTIDSDELWASIYDDFQDIKRKVEK